MSGLPSWFLEEAKNFIKTPSVTAEGNEAIANISMSLMRSRGLKCQIQHVTHSNDLLSKRQFNVIGILGDSLVDWKTKRGLLLNTHLDTVGPGILEHWSETGGSPFAATVKDGKIFGLGSADVKLDFLCKLAAIERVRDRKIREPVYLVGTCGEEVGMFGVKYLIQSKALNPRFAVVGEPSELRVIYAHKCYAIFRISLGFHSSEKDTKGFNRRILLTSLGRSAHAGYPQMGLNAIQQLLHLLHRALKTGFDLRFSSVTGGDSINKVPDRSATELFVNSQQYEDFKRFLRDVVKAEGTEKLFRAELGGAGAAGVKFLAESVMPALLDLNAFLTGWAVELEKTKDDSYRPSHSTMNLGKVSMDRPGFLDVYLDTRLLPDLPVDQAEKRIQDEIQRLNAKYPILNLKCERQRVNPPLNMSMNHELVKICRESAQAAGFDPLFDKKATSTEAAQYFQAGIESVVFGPGLSHGNSHSPNEFNLLDQLEKAISFYEKLIEKVCL